MQIEIREYIDSSGRNAFGNWSGALDDMALVKVQTSLQKLEQGNFSSARSVGNGVHELRIHSGPGYRVYFGRDGDALILLLGGGTKRRQQRDIDAAKGAWHDYRRHKSSIGTARS